MSKKGGGTKDPLLGGEWIRREEEGGERKEERGRR